MAGDLAFVTVERGRDGWKTYTKDGYFLDGHGGGFKFDQIRCVWVYQAEGEVSTSNVRSEHAVRMRSRQS